MQIWLDLTSRAAREVEPYRSVAGQIEDAYLAWITKRVETRDGDSPSSMAALLLASIEGMSLVKAIGRPQVADAAMREILASLKI